MAMSLRSRNTPRKSGSYEEVSSTPIGAGKLFRSAVVKLEHLDSSPSCSSGGRRGSLRLKLKRDTNISTLWSSFNELGNDTRESSGGSEKGSNTSNRENEDIQFMEVEEKTPRKVLSRNRKRKGLDSSKK